MPTSAEKMYALAKALGDLNAAGEVKAILGNELGYARVADLPKPGCTLFVRHELGDTLRISLTLTPTHERKHGPRCQTVSDAFKRFFGDANHRYPEVDYQDPLATGETRHRFAVDVTALSDADIWALLMGLTAALPHASRQLGPMP